MDRKLPDWLKESREAEKLIAWLKSPDCEVKELIKWYMDTYGVNKNQAVRDIQSSILYISNK